MFSLSLNRSMQILNGAVTSDRSPVWSYNIPMGWRLKTRKHSSPRRKPIYLECLSFHSQRPLMRTNGYLPETDTLMTGTNRYTKLMTSTTTSVHLSSVVRCPSLSYISFTESSAVNRLQRAVLSTSGDHRSVLTTHVVWVESRTG